VVSVRIPQRLMLADGTFFPPGCCAVLWGRASTPAGVAPEALQERGCSCKVFSQSLPVYEVLVSAGVDNVSAGLGSAMRTYLAYICVWCIPRGVAVHRAPQAWARLRRSRGALRLVYTPLRHPSAGQRGEASTTPIERVTNCGFLVELLSG
jgi:tetrahydromethanopterin S-methyltransferase subunit H